MSYPEMPGTAYVYSINGVTITESNFGSTNGEIVKKYTWQTDSGFSVSVISFGAIIQAIKVKDKHGEIKDIALGFEDLEGYLTMNRPDLLGGAVGRCVGRIARGTFEIDDVEFQLTKNCGNHHLHGGFNGFDRVNWKSTREGSRVIFSYLSKDGEEGYPGDVMVNITYEVKKDDSFYVRYIAVTNKKTVVNLSNHSYFNLAGHETGAEELYKHTIVINADNVLEGDTEWVPTGKFLKVGGTPFDLRIPKRLGDVISNDADSLRFHHNFVLNRNRGQDLTFVARVHHPPTGRFMEIHSDQPSVIFYTGNYIHDLSHPDMVGKEGILYGRCGGLCLETMNLVDAIHHVEFPSPVLIPGDVYSHRVKYSFGAMFDC